MITKLNGTGLTSDEFNARNDAREDGMYGIDDDMVMTVCQWYMPSKADDVMTKAGHGLMFSTDDLALWMEENVSLVQERDWEILTRYLAERDNEENLALRDL